MKMLALTGANHTAQAKACELVLDLAKRAGVEIFVALDCDCPEQLQAIGQHGHLVEVWRIGEDTTKPALDHLVDAQLTDQLADLPAAVARQLQTFSFKAATLARPALTPQEQTP